MTATKPAPSRDQIRAAMREEFSAALAEAMADDGAIGKQFQELQHRVVAAENAPRRLELPGSEDATHRGQKYSMQNVIRALMEGGGDRNANARIAPLEFEMSEQLRKTYAQGNFPGTSGGFLVPTSVSDEIVGVLKANSILGALGVTTIPVDTFSSFKMPKVVSEPEPEARHEHQEAAESSMKVAELRAEPRSLGVYVEADRASLIGARGMEQMLRMAIAENMALKQDKWGLRGKSADGEPMGIINVPGIQTVDFTNAIAGGKVTADFYRILLRMPHKVKRINAPRSALKFAAHPDAIFAAQQIGSETDDGSNKLHMVRQSVADRPADRLVGYPFEESTQLRSYTDDGVTTDLIFGAWNTMSMVSFGNLIIDASDIAGGAFRKRERHFVAFLDIDFLYRYGNTFCMATNLNTSSLLG